MRLACVALLLAIGRPAFADPSEADRLAAEANALASQGKLAEAASTFRAAYAQDPRPQLICNVGVAYYKANDLPRAAFYLDQCRALGAQLDAAFLDNVDKVLAAVRRVLAAGDFAPVTFVVDPQTAAATIEASPFDEPIIGQRSVWVPFGTYRVHVHQDGYVDHDEPLHVSDRAPVTLHIQLAKPAVEPPKLEPPKPEPPKPIAPPPVPAPAITAHHPSRVPAIAATAGTLALGVLGGLAYLHALDLNDQAGATHDRATYNSLRASTLDYKHLSWVAGGLAGAGAIASGLLWYRSMHVEVAPDHAVAMIGGTF